jgi:dinuclear metal center YbgI/SA1388 family protein
MIQDLIRHGVAVYSPHTAWDNSATGINQQLAELLELTDIHPLRPRVTSNQVKIVTSLPESSLDAVRQALWKSGAGIIGDYQNCSFSFPGTGTFYGLEASHPVVGQSGRLEQVAELRLEVVCPTSKIETALVALRVAHPYEEPAIEVYSLTPIQDGSGAGRFGQLSESRTLEEVCQLVAKRLGQFNLQFVGSPSQVIKRIGIACGAAGEYLRDAHRAGCDLFITGEARFHTSLEAIDLGMGLIIPGHYATERFAMETLAKRLTQQFPGLSVTASEREKDPVRTLST